MNEHFGGGFMDGHEYEKIWREGQREFYSIDHNVKLSKLIKEELPFVMEFNKQPLEVIREYQLNELKKIVDYAYMNIPLYKEKYDKVGYKPGDIRSFEDFEKLPFLYKDELIEGFPNKISKNISDFKYSTRSSGTSARFVTISLDIEAIYKDTLQGIRQFSFQSNYKYKPEHRVLLIYTCPWWIQNICGKYNLDFLPTTVDVKKAYEFIKSTKPFIISTYPTYLQKICDLDVNLASCGVNCIIVHSEQSNKLWRSEMAHKLGVEVFDEYSSEELTRIALECSDGRYHIEEDACYIEIVDKDTKEKVLSGEGAVVGTNLINKSTPIIRYWQGDFVKIVEDKNCKCGYNSRIITSIQGREMDCIISDGEYIPASAFMDLAYNWFLTFNIPVMGMRYQIVQKSENKIVVYLKKGAFQLSEEDIYKIKESLYLLVSRKISIDIIFTNNFIQNGSKFKSIIREKF